MSKRFRQYFGLLAAVISYYIIHEGAHLVAALYYGVFKGINFMGLGMQPCADTCFADHFHPASGFLH